MVQSHELVGLSGFCCENTMGFHVHFMGLPFDGSKIYWSAVHILR